MKAIFVIIFAVLLVEISSDTPPPECPYTHGQHVLFFPNPDDCSTFYQCDRDTPLLMQCNQGLEYNPKLQACDWPKKTVACKRLPPSMPSHPPHSSTATPTRDTHKPTSSAASLATETHSPTAKPPIVSTGPVSV